MIKINIDGNIEDYFCAAYLVMDKAYILFKENIVELEAKDGNDEKVKELFISELKEYREHKELLNKTNDDRNLMYKKALLTVESTANEVDDIAKPWSEEE